MLITDSILLYFIKVNLALALFYLLYRLLFQNDTFFQLRRFTLLGGYLIIFLYPLPDITEWLSVKVDNITDMVVYYSAFYPEIAITSNAEKAISWSWSEIVYVSALCIYLIGIVLLTGRFFKELVSIWKIWRESTKTHINGIKIASLPAKDEAHSFFNWIFIYPEMYDQRVLNEILHHEVTHARQKHSFDVIISEIVCIFCWINPFARLLKKEVVLNHEFIADQAVIYAGNDKKAYQYHLIGEERINVAAAKLYNNFSVLPLKKRITMLNKKRTNCVGKVKYLAIIPFAIGLLFINNIDAMARVVTERLNPASEVVLPETNVQIPEAKPIPASWEDASTALPPQDDPVFTIVEVNPEFPGGEVELLKFINTTMSYPQSAQDKGIQGRVTASFIVEKDGSISDINIVRALDPALDEEAIRVIKAMPKWTPGKQRGQAVRVRYTLPIVYRLQ
ncbi:M56 family metallopeptidase [Parabacteroides sp. OttesenSCG-928-G07]|nr:M56 family metallopeptidase [Parabacteroides sp. OttesenSCG-928-G07]